MSTKDNDRPFTPVCEPFLDGNEVAYVTEAVRTGWISSAGKYVKGFEEKFAEYCGVRYAVAVCNGTAALHVALAALDVGEGDEVLIPDFTMIASAVAVCLTGAMPVFIDAEADTWNIDPGLIERRITPRTKAIMPVSIFGHPCEMDAIRALAGKYGLAVIEDAAESHGAEYRGKRTGRLADITAFSFFANKNITTGEGGMVVTDDQRLSDRVRYFKNLCFPLDAPRAYLHDEIGFNYRMSNLHAAIGLAQVEKADEYRDMRIRNGGLYRTHLQDVPGITMQRTRPEVLNVCWMNAILIEPDAYGRTMPELAAHLREQGIDTRLLFAGMHRQPALLKYGCDCSGSYGVTDMLTENGCYLPSASNLEEGQIAHICDIIRKFRKR